MALETYLGSVVHDGGEVVGTGLRSGVLAVELCHVLSHIVPCDVQVRVSVEPEVRFIGLDRIRSKRQEMLMTRLSRDVSDG